MQIKASFIYDQNNGDHLRIAEENEKNNRNIRMCPSLRFAHHKIRTFRLSFSPVYRHRYRFIQRSTTILSPDKNNNNNSNDIYVSYLQLSLDRKTVENVQRTRMEYNL